MSASSLTYVLSSSYAQYDQQINNGPPPPNQPHYSQHPPPPAHSPMQGYPPPLQQSHHMSNGVTSPHAPPYQPPLQSPTRHQAPLYHGFGPGRTESPFTPAHLPPYDPRNSQGSRVAEGPPPPALVHQTSQPPQHMSTQTSPHASQARPDSQAGPPTTPRESQGSGTPIQGASGASASPRVGNLLS